eukprot:c14001_g1_i1.p1 GENE.c14001_g1_i1~~c14001_g1_i1.p1  ORF type:complete len:112 (+),score=19.14 c14001_g1_i1:30-338(+)
MRRSSNGRIGQRLRELDATSSDTLKEIQQIVRPEDADLASELAAFAATLGLSQTMCETITTWSNEEIQSLTTDDLLDEGFDQLSAARIVAKARGISKQISEK